MIQMTMLRLQCVREGEAYSSCEETVPVVI